VLAAAITEGKGRPYCMFEGYKFAAGSANITPQEPIPLAGYAGLRRPRFERVADRLETNIILLRSGDQVAAFVALDLMYVGAYLRDRIVDALSSRISPEGIFLASSHTHFGPPTEDSLPVLGAVSLEYRDFVARRVIELALRLLDERFVPVSLDYREGLAAQTVNRRSKAFGVMRQFPFIGSHMRITPNPRGPRDDMIRLIRITDSDHRVVAVCWSYACHPVGFPNINEVSAEYPGFVRNMLRASLGHVPVVFWQGFSGNVSPFRYSMAAGGDQASLRARDFVAADLEDWNRWASRLGTRVVDLMRGQGTPILEPIKSSSRSLSVREIGLHSHKELRLQEIWLGSDLVVSGLSAEVAVEYVELLRTLRAPARVIPVGCVGDVYGYLPVDAMVPEGGYEVRGFVPRFGLRGRVIPNVTSVVAEKLFRSARGM
jgi:neutral ceramidase